MKSIEKVKTMDLETIRAYRANLNLEKVDEKYLEKVDIILSIREAEANDYFDNILESNEEWSEAIPLGLNSKEVEKIKKVIELAKKEEGLSNSKEALLYILEFYKENKGNI